MIDSILSLAKLCNNICNFFATSAYLQEAWRPTVDDQKYVAAIVIDLSEVFDLFLHELKTVRLQAS